jgi:hypothetical protein
MAASAASSAALLFPREDGTLPDKPLFSNEPISYLKLESEEGHVFIVDLDAAVSFSDTIRSQLEIQRSISEFHDLKKDEIPILAFPFPTRALENFCKWLLYKKRWNNVVTEKIPNHPLPKDLNLLYWCLIMGQMLCEHY